MVAMKEKYVVGADGKPTAVMLDLRTYRRLLERLEDLEDALELDRAQRAAKTFRPYEAIRAELKKAGRL
jgi:PHD/YefM family antitoxin component YafN of YafNO toxin-antitoxin module